MPNEGVASRHIYMKNLKFNKHGLIPVIVQEKTSRQVLMMAYANEEAVEKMIETKETWFWSRSRNKLWHKGEESGNYQKIKNIYFDCDEDALLIKVAQKGVACHTGEWSCFFRRLV